MGTGSARGPGSVVWAPFERRLVVVLDEWVG